MSTRIIRAAFDRGQVPTIACINAAKTPLGVDLGALVRALQKFVNDCFAPVWGIPAKLVVSSKPIKGAWALVFLDDADAPGALGYHDLTPDGLPLSKVFVKTTLGAGEKVSVTASHELAEMLLDPAINLWSDGPKNTLYAYEACDAVEEVTFNIDGIAMSDFVYPSFFEVFRKPNSTQFDFRKKLSRPFQILSGGYSLVRKGTTVKQIFGSKRKAKRFRREDRRLHRTEYRKALLEGKPWLRRSAVRR
jgi:hypothetical protein